MKMAGSYICNECDKAFKYRIQIIKHINTHKQLNKHSPSESSCQCKRCGRRFSDQYNLEMHIRHHQQNDNPTSKKYLQLKNNSFNSTSLNSSKNYVQIKQEIGENIINYNFITSVEVKQEINEYDTEFETEEQLITYYNNTESDIENTCDNDEIIVDFDVQELMKLQRYNKSYKSDSVENKTGIDISDTEKSNTINENITNKGIVKSVAKNKKREKPYKCDVCNTTFTLASNLRRHMKLHSNNKYICNICKKEFAQNRYLVRHKKFHSIKKLNGKKPLSCEICDKLFSCIKYLQQHMLVHTNEKPYNCDICDKGFTRRGNLQEHMRIHTGEKPYSCDICLKTFAASSNFRNHIRFHKGLKQR